MRQFTKWDKATPSERFWDKVDKSGDCWIWMAVRHKKMGYGLFGLSHRQLVLAHRFAYEQAFGAIPDGLSVLHRCDNPPCCNPEHLFLGTRADNIADMCAKGRHPHGETHGYSKLTWDAVRAIRAIYRERRATQTQIAEQFGVDQTTVSLIVLNRIWKEGK